MKLDDMTTSKFYNILCNLNNMESVFLEQYPDLDAFEKTTTYRRFLDNYFIKKNNLAQIYFLTATMSEEEVEAEGIEDLGKIGRLKEINQIALGLDIMLTKQFNFPCRSLHVGDCFECVYVMQGLADFSLLDKVYPLKEGDFFFHTQGDGYALNAYEDSIVINMDFRKSYINKNYPVLFARCGQALEFFDRCFSGSAKGNYLLFHTDNREELKELVLRMFLESFCREQYSNEIVCSNFAILVSYLKRYAADTVETIKGVSLPHKYYDEIVYLIEQHYQDISLEMVANKMHFSKQYVARIVHNMTGDSFSRLVRTMRIEKACEYLRETSLTVEDIADLVGFSSNSYFWRAFVSVKGMPPSEYRQQVQDAEG